MYFFFQTGRTPLHAACSEGHEKVVTTLIELGANQAALDKVCEKKDYYLCVNSFPCM